MRAFDIQIRRGDVFAPRLSAFQWPPPTRQVMLRAKRWHVVSLRITVLVLLLTCLFVLRGPVAEGKDNITIGAIEEVTLLPWGVTVLARIDTGAAVSSLDACKIRVRRKTVYFSLPDRCGGFDVSLPLAGWRKVKSAQGAGRRPLVEIEVCLAGKKAKALVTLTDRAHMEYPLLIGRNILEGGFVVDVGLVRTSPSGCPEQKNLKP